MATRQHYIRIFNEKIFPRVILILMSVFFLLPFYWMIITSIKSLDELQRVPPTLIPHSFHWENFVRAVNYIPFFRFLRNSLILAASSVVGAVISNSLVSYSVARINWKGREQLFYLIVATMFLPFPVILVAVFDIYAKFRMINTFWPLILPYFMGSATHIFMMRQYLLSIPLEISDAGFIDGANEWQIFFRLILPIMKPAIAVVAIFSALAAWSDLLGPLLYLQRDELYPLSIGLQFFRTQHQIQYSELMAASTLVTLPVVVIFICFQRFFVEGITIGAVKG
jgi:multiple sugar transport system permease protein